MNCGKSLNSVSKFSNEEESIVDIRAIGIKEGNRVRIGGEIVDL